MKVRNTKSNIEVKSDDEKFEDTLKYVIDSVDNASDVLAKDVRNDDIVLFLGNSRAGKSTLINYLAGNELIATKGVGKLRSGYAITKNDPNNEKGPAIGMGAKAETTLPSRWEHESIEGVIWDAPGWDDNRGDAQDITNAFYIKELLSNAKSVKFVFVSDINDVIHDSIKPFLDFLKKICVILPDLDRLKDGVAIIFTKVGKIDDTDTYITVHDIQNELYEKIIYQQGIAISDTASSLVQHFIDTPKSIGIFRKPMIDGIIGRGSGVDDGVIKAINCAQRIDSSFLVDAKFGISAESSMFLHKSYNIICKMEDFDYLLQEVHNSYLRKIENIVADVADSGLKSREAALRNKRAILADFKSEIHKMASIEALNLQKMLIDLSELPNVKEAQLVQKSKVFAKSKFIAFIEQVITDVNHVSIFQNKLLATVAMINKDIDYSDLQISFYLNEITKIDLTTKSKQLEADCNNLVESYEGAVKNFEAANEEFVAQSSSKVQKFMNGLKVAGSAVGGLVLGAVGGAIGAVLSPFTAAYLAGKAYYESIEEDRENSKRAVEARKKEIEQKKKDKLLKDAEKAAVDKERQTKLQVEAYTVRKKEAMEAEKMAEEALKKAANEELKKELEKKFAEAQLKTQTIGTELEKVKVLALNAENSRKSLYKAMEDKTNAHEKVVHYSNNMLSEFDKLQHSITAWADEELASTGSMFTVQKMVNASDEFNNYIKVLSDAYMDYVRSDNGVKREVYSLLDGTAEKALLDELMKITEEDSLPPNYKTGNKIELTYIDESKEELELSGDSSLGWNSDISH